MCDQIAIINQGELVARDSTEQLLARLDNKTMVIEPEETPSALPDAEGLDVTLRPDGTLAISYQSTRLSAETVLEAVRHAGIRCRDVRTEQADLQDVFLELTRSR